MTRADMILVRLAGDSRFPESCSYNTRPLFSSLRRMPWAGATRQGGNWRDAIVVRTGTDWTAMFFARATDGMKVSPPVNSSVMDTTAAQTRSSGRSHLPRCLVIINAPLLLIVYTIPALSHRETRCQLPCGKTEANLRGRSKSRNSNSGHRVADSPTYSDARSS